jgi:OOP family OmpA-OmpF porin
MWSNVLLFLLAGTVLFGCQTYQAGLINPSYQPADLNSALQAGQYRQKVDNFFVILDSSGSKDETYRGFSKTTIANDFLNRMNMTIPDMDLQAGMRNFGGTRSPFAKRTQLIYGTTQYSKEGFKEALDRLKWGGGESPAEMAIDASSEDMSIFEGKTAFIFVGDGQYAGNNPAAAAARLKDRYGDNLCIYPVLVGSEDPASVESMQAIADAGQCGFYQSAKYLESPEDLSKWIADVFLVEVKDDVKKRAPLAVGDSDEDGIPDNMDQCPNTPLSAPVNSKGCWMIENVEFDFNQYNLKPESITTLEEVAGVMRENPAVTVRIDGHTDNVGGEEYNMTLGGRRAEAARQFLINQGVPAERLSIESFGYSRPTATNSTDWGRARNRRAEFKWSR